MSGIPADTVVVIRAWREKRDGTMYDGQLVHCRFRDLPDRIERYHRQRRHAEAFLRNQDHDPDPFGDEAIQVGAVWKHEDTGRWVWWSDGPECVSVLVPVDGSDR
jgi:hypothetical protein